MPVIIVVINNAARIAIINNNNDGLPGGLQLPPDEATPVRRAVHGAECAGSELGRSEVQVDERNRPPASALCLPASSEPWHRSGSPREAKTAFSFLVLKSRPEQARIRVLLGGGELGQGVGGGLDAGTFHPKARAPHCGAGPWAAGTRARPQRSTSGTLDIPTRLPSPHHPRPPPAPGIRGALKKGGGWAATSGRDLFGQSELWDAGAGALGAILQESRSHLGWTGRRLPGCHLPSHAIPFPSLHPADS